MEKNKKKLNELVKKLVASRNEAVKLGQVYAVQEINQMLVKVARKLKVDYYSL